MNDIEYFDLPYRFREDFSAHNEMNQSLWEAFAQNEHERTPVQITTNPRMLMLDSRYNRAAPSYRAYMTNPDVMAQCVLEWSYWMRFMLPGDHEKGMPESWQVHIDFQNVYDAAFLGSPVMFHDNQVPYAAPLLNDDNKRMLFDRGISTPFTGEWVERALQFQEHFQDKSSRGWTFLGRPVLPPDSAPFAGTDGPFTAAAALRGPTGICTDMLVEPDYAHELLDYITEALITRMQAWRQHFGHPPLLLEWGTADDSIEMLSVEQYREFVLPHHRRLFDAFCPDGKRGIHLCGNVQRFFPVLKEELNVTSFDTGFPVDFARFREEMGPDILLSGGPRAPLFVEKDPAPLLAETERILMTGIGDSGRFILREGNNLPPCTPLENCEAFYRLGCRLGRIPR